jgi:uncharacterized protein HemX
MSDNGNGQPQNLVQATGQVANKVVSSLSSQPTLLMLMLLNAIMVGGATYLLLKREEYRQVERAQLVKILERCTDSIRPLP